MGVHSTTQVYDQIKDLLGIPEDEPIFILRGKDEVALPTIREYEDLRVLHKAYPPSEDWLVKIHQARNEFIRFKLTYPHKMKLPD